MAKSTVRCLLDTQVEMSWVGYRSQELWREFYAGDTNSGAAVLEKIFKTMFTIKEHQAVESNSKQNELQGNV